MKKPKKGDWFVLGFIIVDLLLMVFVGTGWGLAFFFVAYAAFQIKRDAWWPKEGNDSQSEGKAENSRN